MKTHSLRLKRHINQSIEVGNVVKLIDGSGLTHKNKNGSYYIIYPYVDETGLEEPLENCYGVVTEKGLYNYITESVCRTAYMQDIVVKIGNAEFRTCSQFVEKINEPTIEYTIEDLIKKIGHSFKIKK